MKEITKQHEQVDPLKKMIISIISAMKADYGDRYKKQFEKTEDLDQFKQRLYQKLKGLDMDCIVDGYELCAERNPKFVPTVIDLVACILEVSKAKSKRLANQHEAEAVAALPSPAITQGNPIKMLRDANSRAGDKTDHDAWMKRKADKLAAHNLELKKAANKIKTVDTLQHTCATPGCYNSGTMSHSTTGGSNFYCSSHYQKTF